MPNIIIKNEFGEDEIYNGINTVRFLTDTGETASFNHGGAKPNIAWGDTAPQKTDKLWVKCPEPESYVATIEPMAGAIGGLSVSDYINDLGSWYKVSCAAVGKCVYMFGGGTRSSGNTSSIRKLDTEAKTLTKLAQTLPESNLGGGCAAIGTDIYVFGGYPLKNKICKFDTLTETLVTLAVTLPYEYQDGITCAAFGTSIYLFGGKLGNSSSGSMVITKFDTETETATVLDATLPKALHSGCATTVNGYIYIFGGCASGTNYHSDILKFDPTTENVETITATLPQATAESCCACAGSSVYIFGGQSTSLSSSIVKFDALAETVETEEATLTMAMRSSSCASVGESIYLMGGYGSSSNNNKIYQCQTPASLTAGTAYVQLGSENLFDFIPGLAVIGVTAAYVGNPSGLAEVAEAYLFDEGLGEWTMI